MPLHYQMGQELYNLFYIHGKCINNIPTAILFDQEGEMVEEFENCKKIQSLNLSSFVTRNVATMKKMFSECKELSDLLNDLSRSLIFSESSTDFERIFLFYL